MQSIDLLELVLVVHIRPSKDTLKTLYKLVYQGYSLCDFEISGCLSSLKQQIPGFVGAVFWSIIFEP